MKYMEAVKQSMQMLAEKEGAIFIGYNVKYGSHVYGTITDVSESQRLETPVAENLMTGLALGMSLENIRPVLCFERHDFMLNGLDALANHLDKFEEMSEGQFHLRVIIRAIIGSKKPLYPGLQHTQNFTRIFKMLFSFPVLTPETPEAVLRDYEIARNAQGPCMVIENRALYESVG